jgi:hypothetical protein
VLLVKGSGMRAQLCFGLLIGLTEFAEIAGGRSLQRIVMNGGILLLMVLWAFATGYAAAPRF